MSYRCKSPVLFLVFNRPDVTARVFERIRKAQPSHLYVAADGPRNNRNGEADKCKQVREIATSIDWDCEVKTLFRDENMGCGRAVSNAITWFFDNVEEGIILEDDCLPSTPFFRFCDELLEKFRYDYRVGSISGSYSKKTNIDECEDYFLARYGRIWGWASWRRAWNNYEFNISFWPRMKNLESYKCFFEKKEHAEHYRKIWDRVYAGEIDTWDYQWDLCKLANLQFTIVSTSNLVDNLGFSPDSTHTSNDPVLRVQAVDELKFPLNHPKPLLMDYRRDRETHAHRYPSTSYSVRALRKLKRIFK